VLDVARAEEFGRRLEILLVDARFVKFRHHLLVFLHLRGVGGMSGRRRDRNRRGGEQQAKHEDLLVDATSLLCGLPARHVRDKPGGGRLARLHMHMRRQP
jgi:hypothetical protein